MAKIGRPKGATNISTRAIKDIIDECVDMKDVVNKLIELIEGVEVEDSSGEETVIYTTKPDVQAAKILLEYRYGKPNQSVALSGEVGLIQLISEIKNDPQLPHAEDQKKLIDNE